MKRNLIASIFVLTFCVFVFGQDSTCPTISVTGPASVVKPDEDMDFMASVSGIDASKIGYKWTVTKGTIIQGQGTNKILVNIKGFYDNAITATVEFLNLPEGCENSVSETGIMACSCTPFILDEFGKIPLKDQKARLSVIKDELEKNKEYIAYIILYYSLQDYKNLNKRAERIKNLLVKEIKIPSERVVIISGGEEPEELTRIYLVPAGAEPPTP